MRRICTFLIAVALMAGMVGCTAAFIEVDLTISSTEGGSVSTPGEGDFVCGLGVVVNLIATPDAGYRFVDWTGDVEAIADVESAKTTITMNGAYSVEARFVAVHSLNILSSAGGSVTVPGEGVFTFDAGTVVDLMSEATARHDFVDWSGDVGSVADIGEARTTITMNNDYLIVASFVMPIRDWHDLHSVRDNLTSRCFLINDLDATTEGYAELASVMANDAQAWQPIGTLNDPFVGNFDGQGYEIRDMYINRPGEMHVGLFGYVAGGRITDLGIVDSDVTGGWRVGGLVGYSSGSMSSVYSHASVVGADWVGGLVGLNVGTISDAYSAGSVDGHHAVGGVAGMSSGVVTYCHAATTVTGVSNVGGLVGGIIGTGSVIACHATGSVTGDRAVGGLVGANAFVVSKSYSGGSVTGCSNVGGLVGVNYGTVSKSYSDAAVTGTYGVGGLVGVSGTQVMPVGDIVSGIIRNSYAVGDVTGETSVGGLVGANVHDSSIGSSYSGGTVIGEVRIGGLVGMNDAGIVRNSFWDTETSGLQVSEGGIGKTTADMMDITTYTDTETEGLDTPWDISAVTLGYTSLTCIWNIVDNQTYPFLSWQAVS